MAIRKIEKLLTVKKPILYNEYWLFDIVSNANHEIVAMCFHLSRGTGGSKEDCLNNTNDIIELKKEGLALTLSTGNYCSLEEAKAGAWLLKDKFHKSLD
jgi:hypothetical protein